MRGFCHGPALFFYQLVLVALVWLCLMLQWAWPSDRVTEPSTPPSPTPPRRKRRCEPKLFAGLTRKPHCDACEPVDAPCPHAPSTPPPRIVMTRGRRRAVDTATHFCPNPDCRYWGWAGWGNIRANGHPNGGTGANCCASSVAAIFWRPSVRSFMASAPPSSSSCASSRAWPKAWVSGVRRGCLRWTRIPC